MTISNSYDSKKAAGSTQQDANATNSSKSAEKTTISGGSRPVSNNTGGDVQTTPDNKANDKTPTSSPIQVKKTHKANNIGSLSPLQAASNNSNSNNNNNSSPLYHKAASSQTRRALVRSASPLPRPHQPPPTNPYDDDSSPSSALHLRKHYYQHNETLKRVQRVSRHAALQTKQQFWDSNEVGIDAAMSAVDQWESLYNALRNLIVTGVHSAHSLYRTAKQGSSQLEHGILLPIRDWILLPAFVGLEKAVFESAQFLQSTQAQQLAQEMLGLVSQVPMVGDNVLAPSLCFSINIMQRTWDIVQYPIPSKQQVRQVVDLSLNTTKWALTSVGHEIYFFVKRADANITRTLSHTQWKVLGSGPYATLDKLVKRDVIDHVCERYLSLLHDVVSRYELAAHISKHNPPLYHDIVLTGLLKARGGEATRDDEWLNPSPAYRKLDNAFFIDTQGNDDESQTRKRLSPSALWYRWPRLNGLGPSNDTPWIPYCYHEQKVLERKYQSMLQEKSQTQTGSSESELCNSNSRDGATSNAEAPLAETANTFATAKANSPSIQAASALTTEPPDSIATTPFPTNAQWYDPDLDHDILVDQKRHAISFEWCCPQCRQPETTAQFCSACQQINASLSSEKTNVLINADNWWGMPPLTAIQRPTLWRFYGPGDAVRRATWLLESPRCGLQPFDELAQAVLEDAYLFLQWMSVRQEFNQSKELEGALLTVEVPCPDGTERLVQFSSLNQATAIQKGVFSAVSLFKRRVYRGSWLEPQQQRALEEDTSENERQQYEVEKSILQAVQDNGSLGDTLVPDTGLRAVLTPPPKVNESQIALYDTSKDLSVPASRFWEDDMTKHMRGENESDVDHLVLVVHGIGEMMRSADIFGMAFPTLSSIIDCCGYLRKNHSEVQKAHFLQMNPGMISDSQNLTGRTDYIPVEWHEAFSIFSQRRDGAISNPKSEEDQNRVMINDISLRTIPNMRHFANDTLMDVLYFMSPEHHDMIVSIVTFEMNTIVDKFRRLTGFSGRVSLIGHSLGSIVAWDILANQEADDIIEPTSILDTRSNSLDGLGTGTEFPAAISDDNNTPELTQSNHSKSSYPQLNFPVDNFFLLGSPVAVFLMIRNQRKPLDEDYYLQGCNRVFNIFHPYDPIAYRIEPCLHHKNCDFEPVIMKHWNGGFRVQYQTKRLWRKLVQTTFRTQQNMVDAFEKSMAYMGLIDSESDSNLDDESEKADVSYKDSRLTHVVTGALNQGRRIDYMLQEKEIETANEYVAAFAAHSSYWNEKDLSLFIAKQIYLSALEMTLKTSENDDWENLEEDT